MSKNFLKEQYRRLKQWQEKPFDYEFATNEEHHCNNCGHTFKGNYCPYCSQKAGEGDIGWKSVRQSLLDIWGLGSRSLPHTILQLLLRPGHLISDYINGKRQVSFPPVKMLFIVSVIVVFWVYYLLPAMIKGVDVYGGLSKDLAGFEKWNMSHFVWNYFFMSMLYVLPTWILFRHSPVNTRHTLPQGFFIQIFLLVLNLLFSFIILSPLLLTDYIYYLCACWIVIIAYFFIAYKRLFGYGAWGTLWRLVFVFGSVIDIISSLTVLLFGADSSLTGQGTSPFEQSKYYVAGITALRGLLILAIGWGINLIVTRLKRKKGSSNQ